MKSRVTRVREVLLCKGFKVFMFFFSLVPKKPHNFEVIRRTHPQLLKNQNYFRFIEQFHLQETKTYTEF